MGIYNLHEHHIKIIKTLFIIRIVCTKKGEEDKEEEVSEAVATAVAGAAATIAFSMIATPPLGMFPPQGLPQPASNIGSFNNGGGGSSPASASSVIKT